MPKRLSHTDIDLLSEKILLQIVPIYVQAHAAHVANVLNSLDEIKAKNAEERQVAEIKRKTVETSVLKMATGCVGVARLIAREWEITGNSEFETALNKGRVEELRQKLNFGENGPEPIDLGNDARH